MLSVVRLAFAHNGKPNRWAYHDVGLASAQLVLQAVSQGLVAHQMAGFDAAKARETYGIPEGHEPVAAIAVGYPFQSLQYPFLIPLCLQFSNAPNPHIGQAFIIHILRVLGR